MKKIYLSVIAAVTVGSVAIAQPCTTTRYASDVFTTVTTTTGIAYGSNLPYNSTTTPQTLTLDLYEPAGDVATARPLIIWAHGGSFVGGTSTDADVVSLSQHFAKKGYVCASINYRLGVTSFDSVGLNPAVVRAVQDMKAAIRFFYKDKLTTDTYKIDTNNIFIGGSSAGAITALHTAYLDRTCEINGYINQTKLTSLGGLDGYSGNQCYSQNIKGVIDLCGALGVYGWFEAGNLPLCSMHGTADATVPYSRGIVNPGIPIQYVDGSRMIYQQGLAVGVPVNFYTFYGAPHVPYAGSSASQVAYMDTTVNFVRDYLLQRMGITCTDLQAPNAPKGTANLYAYTPCTTNVTQTCYPAGIKNANANLLQEVYPNPSENAVKIVFANVGDTHVLQLTDATGLVISTNRTNQATYLLEKNTLTPGVYFLRVSNSNAETTVQKIIFY